MTTPIGAEGIYDGLEWSGAIAEDAEGFAEAAIALYQNKSIWRQTQDNRMAIVNQLYSKECLSTLISHKINNLQKNLENNRNQNFIGSVLQHQTPMSTKYLSKWIEEKQKKK